MSSREERLMRLALAQGAEALDKGEIPVGCIFVKSGTEEVLARGANKTNELRSGCSHAEMVAINDYLESRGGNGSEEFSHCELFVTCEPCIMCAAALSMLGIQKVFFGCHNERFGGNGSILSIHQDSLLACQRPYAVTTGLLKDEAISLFQRFYSLENRRGKRKTNTTCAWKENKVSKGSKLTEIKFVTRSRGNTKAYKQRNKKISDMLHLTKKSPYFHAAPPEKRKKRKKDDEASKDD